MPRKPRDIEKISIVIPSDLLQWIDEMVEERTFANRSHGIEVCVKRAKEDLFKSK